MRILRKLLFILFTLFVVWQFFPPSLNKSDTTPPTDIILATHPPKQVEAVLVNACYDCHSNNTNYPWYTGVEPLSYWFASHINQGKKKLDFSSWDHYTAQQKCHLLEEISEVVTQGEMPLASYRKLHSKAQLSSEQIEAIRSWTAMLQLKYQLEDRPQ